VNIINQKIVSAAVFCLGTGSCFATTYFIDPSAASNGNGMQASPYNTWVGRSFQPGNTYLQKAGTSYGSQVSIVNALGTAALPIVVGRYGIGANPVIKNIFIGTASYLTIKNFGIPKGLVFNASSVKSHITVAYNDISNPSTSSPGIYLGGEAPYIVITGNHVHNTGHFGILVGTINATRATGTVVSSNFVENIGIHGISLFKTSYAFVTGNVVANTGIHGTVGTGGGGSAIHLYNGLYLDDPAGTEGHNNLIAGNVVYNAHDILGDGNGIQLDRATHDNIVTNNLSFSNDGVGISLYGSDNNLIAGNVFYNNGMDPHRSHSLVGNIVVDAPPLSQRTNGDLTTQANVISNNTVIVSDLNASTGPGRGPFGFEVIPPAGTNHYSGNKLILAPCGAPSDANMRYYHTWSPQSYPANGNDAAMWNAGAGIPNLIIHDSLDIFGTTPVTDIASTTLPMDFIIPARDAVIFVLSGKMETLYGWREDTGLYVTNMTNTATK
jgi:parallel beta-helix repeat protein